MLAIVRHAAPPESPPEDLAPYVIDVVGPDGRPDWHLTDDAVAFAGPDVPNAFWQWRADWERTWTLDPASSLRRLWLAGLELASERPNSVLERLLSESNVVDTTRIFPASSLAELGAEIRRLRDRIRQRDRLAFGFVDVSPGRQRVGLARAWSTQDGPELMAADESLAVEMRPESGLVVHAPGETLSNVDEVTFTGQAVVVRTPIEEAAFDFERARPLGWLMPGVAAWRVRQIPEVIAWARSFAAFDEVLPHAASLGVELRLTTRYPFFGGSSGALTT